jgi:DNA-binding transcriptional ArsR family regulator
MSSNGFAALSRRSDATAGVFAALGDSTRLSLVLALSRGERQSIAQLSASKPLTRQAISKHLRILETAGVVSSRREGRENLFALNPEALDQVRTYVEQISAHWDTSLARLKAFVEK